MAGIAPRASVVDPLGVVGHVGRALRSSETMVRKSVAEILENHVTFELEAIDRMYLNAYVPSLQTGAGFVYFVKTQLGARVPSTMMVAHVQYKKSKVKQYHKEGQALRTDTTI